MSQSFASFALIKRRQEWLNWTSVALVGRAELEVSDLCTGGLWVAGGRAVEAVPPHLDVGGLVEVENGLNAEVGRGHDGPSVINIDQECKQYEFTYEAVLYQFCRKLYNFRMLFTHSISDS